MRLTEITPSNKTYIGIRGNEKIAAGRLFLSMLNIYNGIKTGGLPSSIWNHNFEKFNEFIRETLDILEKCPEPKDPFVVNLKSMVKSYQDQINDLNNELIN